MNKAFLVIAVPAFITSFCWLAFGWGWRVAVGVTSIELAITVAGVVYLLWRENAKGRDPQENR